MSNKEIIKDIILKIKKVKLTNDQNDREQENLQLQKIKMKDKQARLFEKLKLKRQQENRSQESTSESFGESLANTINQLSKFNISNRVYITNKITIPKFRKENKGDRKLVVTGILYNQV